MKLFLVMQKDDEDYSTLPKDAEVVVLFRFIRGEPNIPHMIERCKAILDAASPDDFIVYNGPSYLCAIAGYVWMTQEDRVRVNFYSFNKTAGLYCPHTDLLEPAENKDLTHG